MIHNLDELMAYADQKAEALPELAAETRIVRPGYPPHTIAALREACPGLPDSYLDVVKCLALDGISIGYFQLTLSASRSTNKADALRSFNNPTVTPMAAQYGHHGVYQIAAWDSDPICVAHSEGPFRIGQILKYSTAAPRDEPAVLADSFAQFLLIAANLDEIRGRYADIEEPARALEDFREYLAPITKGRQDEMEWAWMRLAGVVLG